MLSSINTIKIEHWKVNNEIFELDSKYIILSYLGSGAYGVVCSASIVTTSILNQTISDHDNNNNDNNSNLVAIKKCKNIFDSRTMAKRTLREIRLLRNISHQNVI